MPFCPTCRQEYVEGVMSCSDCGVALVPVPPPAPVEYPDSGRDEAESVGEERETDLVEVWRSQGEFEAQVIRALLDSIGIRSVIRGEALRITHGLTMDGLAVVRILVRAEEAERAREILLAEELLECPKCGASVRTGDAVCRSCGERVEAFEE